MNPVPRHFGVNRRCDKFSASPRPLCAEDRSEYRQHRRSLMQAVVLIALVTVLTLSTPSTAQTDEMQLLIDRAQNWQSQGQPELARQEWSRILQIDPESIEAIVAIIQLDIATGQREAALQRLNQLRRLAPDHPQIGELSLAAEFAPRDMARLEEARASAAAGDSANAVRLYREAFGNRTPPPALATAYFHQLIEMPGGRERAFRELQAIIDRAEGPTRPFRVLLGQLKTYDPDERVSGMQILQSVATENQRDDSGRAALAAWKQALIWEDGSARSAAALSAYLALNDDTDLRRLRTRAQAEATQRAIDQRRSQAYRALARGDFETAERIFEDFLERSPNSLIDLEGLASTRLGQGRADEAIVLIDRALERASDRERLRLQRLRDDAELSEGFRQADSATAGGDIAQALSIYDGLVGRFPGEANVRAARGALLRAAGQPIRAITDYRQALAQRPDDPAIRSTLVELLLETDQSQDALRLIEATSPDQRNRLQRDPAWLLTEVAVYLANDDRRAARQAFERARRLPLPESAADRLRLAWAWHNTDPGAREIDELIDRIRPMDLSPTLRQDLRELSQIHLRAGIDRLVDAGEFEAAERRIQRAEQEHANDPDVIRLRNDLDLAIAWKLHERQNYSALYAKLMTLYFRTTLTDAQADEMRTLFRVGASAEATPLKRQRHFAAAAMIYNNLNRLFPDDPHYLRELGYLYLEAGQVQDAWAVLSTIRPEHDAGSYSAFLGAALGAGQLREAAALRDEALEHFPDDPDLWELGGTLEETRGRRRHALYYFEQALALRQLAEVQTRSSAAPRIQSFPLAPSTPLPAFSGASYGRP